MTDRQEKQNSILVETLFRPKKIGQKCPVCNGFGTLNWGKVRCHACKGKGYILIPAKEEET